HYVLCLVRSCFCNFFFQAEDGIRDRNVTGVQTCALPISAAVLLKQAAGIDKASGEPNKNKIATVKRDKVKEIAETKMQDLNAADVEAAMRMVEGTARSMGVTIED